MAQAKKKKSASLDLLPMALGGLDFLSGIPSIGNPGGMVPWNMTGAPVPDASWPGPYADPYNRAEQAVNSVATLPWMPSRAGGSIAHWLGQGIQGAGDYLFGEAPSHAATHTKPSGPPTDGGDFTLAGLLGPTGPENSTVMDLGKAPGRVVLPGAPRLSQPNYTASDAALAAAKPGKLTSPNYDLSDQLFAQGAPTATSPEELQKIKKGSILQGIAGGFFQADGKSMSDKILAAGIGALGGMGDYSSKEAAISEKDQEAMRQYSLAGAGRQEHRASEVADTMNKQEEMEKAYQLTVAGHEEHKALEIAHVLQAQEENDLQLKIKQTELDAQYVRDHQTKFVGQVKDGYLMQETGPDGNVHVTMHRINDVLDLAGMTGLDSTQARAALLGLSKPGLPRLQAMAVILESAGAGPTVFQDNYNKIKENAAKATIHYGDTGTAGQQRALKEQLATATFDMANLLARDPEMLKRAQATVMAILGGRGVQ